MRATSILRHALLSAALAGGFATAAVARADRPDEIGLAAAADGAGSYTLSAADRPDTESEPTQIALYGSYRFGGGLYVAGLVLAEKNPVGVEHPGSSAEAAFDLAGATIASRYSLHGEAGISVGIGRGFVLTPHTALTYGSYSLGGYYEGGGELAPQLDKLEVQRLEARLGAQLGTATWLPGGWIFVRELTADYVRTLAKAGEAGEVRFAAAPDQAFLLPLGGGDMSWGEVRGGLGLINGDVRLGAGIASSLGRADCRDDRAIAQLAFRF